VAAYVLGCGFAQALAIVPGTGISIWPPSGLFIATLLLTSRQSWPWWILGGCLAEMLSNFLWFDSPWPAAFLIYVGNALEAVIGAWLVRRVLSQPVRLETLQEVLAFIFLGAGIAPVAAATVGSATLAWFGMQSQSFAGAWPLWWIGDATGVLIVAPLALVVFQNWRGTAPLSPARWIEACVLGLIFLGVAALSLSGQLPFAYLIMPPLLWVAVRFELKGAAITLILLALLTAVFTTSGISEFAGTPESQRQKQILLQLFLAVSAFSALIVAAISRQHQLAALTLRQSMEALRERERELSQLVNMVPSHLWRLTPEGEPIFFNKRMADFLGMDVADMDRPGMSRMDALVEALHPDDQTAFKDSLDRCLATGERFSMRYRLRRADGVYHWMSSRADPMRDENGRITQWYGLCHDIDDQVKAEEALRRSERQLQQMIDTIPVRIWSTMSTGGPVYFNKRYQDHFRSILTDYDAQEGARIDKMLQELVHPDDAPSVQDTLRNCFEKGDGTAMRFRWREKDDVYRWAECRVEPRRDENGEVVQWYGVSLDIDDEVRAQQALRDRERELSLLVEMVPSQVWRLAPDGKATFYNKRLVDFLGLDIATMDKRGISPVTAAITAFVHPDDRASLTEAMNYSLANGERFSMRFRQRRADGVYRWLESRGEPMRDDSGVILQWYGTNVDIDDLVRAQDALRDRERELSQLVDMAPSLIWRLTPDGQPTFFNKRMVDFHDMDVADLEKPGMSRLDAVLETVHPDDVAEYRDALNHSLVTGESFSMRYRLQRADGAYRWMSGRAEPMRDREGRIVQWVALCHDIDDQTRLYSEVAEREAKIRRLIDADIIGIVIWDLDGTLIDANDAFLRTVHYERKDVEAGLRWFDMTPPDWQEVHSHEEAEELAATGKMQPREKEFFRKDGSRVPVLIGAACFEGQSRQGVAYILDLTEQKHAEAALRERERELSQLVETLPAMIDCATPDGEPIYRSQQFCEFLGYELGELDTAGKSRLDGTLDAVHPDDLAGAKETYAHALATGEPCARRFRMRRFDGIYRWVEARAAPIRNAEGAIVQWNVVCIDIDGEVRAEEELRLARERVVRASQVASLAELSASIAHEVNQPLAATVANSHACHRWLTADPPNLERAKITAERIIRDANSAADVVARIRALFSQSTDTRINTSIGSVIAEARDLIAEEAMRRRMRIDVDIENDLSPVALDPIQIQQVLVNLMRNGMEAMDSVTEDRALRVRARRVGNMVHIEISDRGPGVEFPDRIFEPFFTTRQGGMGMGLAICRTIVQSHGGRLWMEKNEPRGAKFIFALPVEVKAE
jgi:PAS domain S-box-containing protein